MMMLKSLIHFLSIIAILMFASAQEEPGEPEEEPERDLVFMVLITPFEEHHPVCNGIFLQQHNVIITHSLCSTRSWVSGYANKVRNKEIQLKYIRIHCPRPPMQNVALWFFEKNEEFFRTDIFTPIQLTDTPLTDYYKMATHLTLILDEKNRTLNATEIPIQVYNYESGAMFAPFNTTEYNGIMYVKQVVDIDINERQLGSALVYDGKLVGVMTELHFVDRVPVYTNISAIKHWITSGIKYLNAVHETGEYNIANGIGKGGNYYDMLYCVDNFGT